MADEVRVYRYRDRTLRRRARIGAWVVVGITAVSIAALTWFYARGAGRGALVVLPIAVVVSAAAAVAALTWLANVVVTTADLALNGEGDLTVMLLPGWRTTIRAEALANGWLSVRRIGVDYERPGLLGDAVVLVQAPARMTPLNTLASAAYGLGLRPVAAVTARHDGYTELTAWLREATEGTLPY